MFGRQTTQPIPVYMINGFLESGKSSFYIYTIGQPYFQTEGKTLLILCEDGEVFTGCNIENGSYPLGNCAERTAIFKAVSEGRRAFIAIAIAGSSDGDFSAPCYPCGACRQVMSEFCEGSLRIILSDGAYTLDELLPKRFKL